VHAEFSSADGNLAATLVALESDRTEIPASFAGLGAVVDEGFGDGGRPEGLFHFTLGHQLFGEKHGRTAS
jgi:hypothetical protein